LSTNSNLDISKQLAQNFKLAADFQKRIVIENIVTLYFLDTIVTADDIQKFIIEPLHQNFQTEEKNPYSVEKILSLISSLKCKIVYDYTEIEEGLINGFTFLSVHGKTSGILIATQDWKERSIEEVYGERSSKGPINGLSENIQINLNMIRNNLRSPELTIETNSFGEKSKTFTPLHRVGFRQPNWYGNFSRHFAELIKHYHSYQIYCYSTKREPFTALPHHLILRYNPSVPKGTV
jgi:spore germination protein KA